MGTPRPETGRQRAPQAGCGSDGQTPPPGAWARRARPSSTPAGSRASHTQAGPSPQGSRRPPNPGPPPRLGSGIIDAPPAGASSVGNCQQAEGPVGTLSTLLTCQRLKGPGWPGGGARGGRRGVDLRIYTRTPPPPTAAGSDRAHPGAAPPGAQLSPGCVPFQGLPGPREEVRGRPRQDPAPPALEPSPAPPRGGLTSEHPLPGQPRPVWTPPAALPVRSPRWNGLGAPSPSPDSSPGASQFPVPGAPVSASSTS